MTEQSMRRHRDKDVLQLPARPPARRAAGGRRGGRRRGRARQRRPRSTRRADPERQNYRLAFWRTAREELDYRRFFDVTTLVGPAHRGRARLRGHSRARPGLAARRRARRPAHRPPRRAARPEDLLRPAARRRAGRLDRGREDPRAGEELPRDWPVAGTTGYDFLNVVDRLFADPFGEDALTALYAGVHRVVGVVRRGRHESEAPGRRARCWRPRSIA